MSTEARFTDEEKLLLASTPALVGSAMALAENSGLGTIKEVMASAHSMMGGLKKYPDNEVIKGVLPNIEERAESIEQARAFREKALARFKDKKIDSPDKIREQVLADCRAVAELLASKASPQEAAEYKEWTMGLAANVAKAAKEGGFLGFGGKRVSEGEQALSEEISKALGATSQLA